MVRSVLWVIRPLTVVMEAQQTFQDQMASMLQQLQQLEDKVTIESKPCVANLAAQILLLACGVKHFHETMTYQSSAFGVEHSRIEAVSRVLDVEPMVFVTRANALVTGRNNMHVHFTFCEALDNEVAEVAGLINPDLRRDLQWECKIVENYSAIQGSIPQ